MAVSGKRLFWVSIIILELVLVYVAYRPVRDHLRRSSHRVASAPRPRRLENPSAVAKNNAPAVNTTNPSAVAKSAPSAAKTGSPRVAASNPTPTGKTNAPAAAKSATSKVVTATAKPSPIPRPHPRPRNLGPVVNAGLKTPEPVLAKPAAALAPSTEESPLDSFWCRISKAEPDCDCKKGEEQASNRVMR